MKPKDLSLVFGDLGPLSLGLVLEPLPLGLVDPDGLALPLLLLLLLRLPHVAREVGSDIDPVLEPVHLPRDLGQILVENAVYLLCIMLRQLVGQVLEPDAHLGVPLRNASPDIPAGLDVGGLGEPIHADDSLFFDETQVLPILGADGLGHELYGLGLALHLDSIFLSFLFKLFILLFFSLLTSITLPPIPLLRQPDLSLFF